MALVYLIVAVVIIFLTACKAYGRKLYWGSKLAGPPALPIIGNALMLANKKPAGKIMEYEIEVKV